MEIPRPYLLFLGDVHDQLAAKTAHGIADWRREWCAGQMRLPGCGADLGLPEMTVAGAAAAGVRTLVLGVTNAGGVLPAHWIETLVAAVEAGMHVASGLHERLADIEVLREAAARRGVRLFDVRHAERTFGVGKGTKRPGLRLLTVGTDCSTGKKYTALALEAALRTRGVDADFRATGQTGILVSGRGVAIDAVVSDFVSGAVEWLAPAADERHWDVIEGQGSLFHPSFAGVTLGLLHGAQPDAFVVCHEPTRSTMRGVAFAPPSIAEVLELTVRCGRLTNPGIRPVGVSINTKALGEDEARRLLEETSREHALPACDPIRFGVDAIADHLLDLFPSSRGSGQGGAGGAATRA